MRKRGFTLIEILVVLAIIAILAAILFPAFKRAREGGHQANCASNLKQIYMAVKLYKDDEARYPASLAFLLPQNADNMVDYTVTPNVAYTNTNGSGHLRTAGVLTCPDDENADSTLPRSSYGDVSTNLYVGPDVTKDPGRYTWNYWGYKADGTSASVADCAGMSTNLLVNPTAVGGYNSTLNPIKRSLSNRYAPEDTVITHCIYHRTSTANVTENYNLYTASSADRQGARDIIIRLDGRSEVLDVSAFDSLSGGASAWQSQTFK